MTKLSLFPFDHRNINEIKLPDFRETFPDANEAEIVDLLRKYEITDAELPRFKEIVLLSEVAVQQKNKRRTADKILKLTTCLLEAYRNQPTLEIIYGYDHDRPKAERHHDQLIDCLTELRSRCKMIIKRNKRSRRMGSYVHLAKAAQRFLFEIGLPFHRHNLADSRKLVGTSDKDAPKGAIYFATDAIKALTGKTVGTGTAENALRDYQEDLRGEANMLEELFRRDLQGD